MAGFFVGILYANFPGMTYLDDTGIFHEHFFSQYVNQDIKMEQYFVYLLKQRSGMIILLILAGATRFRKLAGGLCLLWTGFAGGTLAVAAVIRLGIAGMLYYAAAMLPHGGFYAFAYIIILCYLFDAPLVKWNIWKTIFVVLSFGAGVITEAYVNPQVLKWLLGVLG